jgi:hypothetical protein
LLANKSLTRQAPGGDELYDALLSATEAIEDPSMESERKAIRAKMLLKDLMTNDEVLSQQDPATVIKAFNEIAALAPRSAESPLTMRALLRKSVEQGSVDPMEITNITNIEKAIRESDQPSPLMSEVYKGMSGTTMPKPESVLKFKTDAKPREPVTIDLSGKSKEPKKPEPKKPEPKKPGKAGV